MKIAIPTNDKTTIFEHTGRAELFACATIENSAIKSIEYRKAPEHEHTQGEHSHKELVDLIKDCNVLLVKKIGKHLQNDLASVGLDFVYTEDKTINEAVLNYLSKQKA